MNPALEKHFQVKTEMIGPDPGQQLEARVVLNRVIRWEETGITWEPDPRHAETIIEQVGLKGARSLKIRGGQGGNEQLSTEWRAAEAGKKGQSGSSELQQAIHPPEPDT